MREVAVEEDRPRPGGSPELDVLWDLYTELREILMRNDPVTATM